MVGKAWHHVIYRDWQCQPRPNWSASLQTLGKAARGKVYFHGFDRYWEISEMFQGQGERSERTEGKGWELAGRPW